MAETARKYRRALRKPVVLVGMMGAGKTAVGRALSQMLDVPFLDSDAEIEAAAQMSIAEIFERDGEPFFRRRESEVLARLLDGAPALLSTGGGAFLQDRNRRMISDKGVSVWLKADLDLLWSRVRHKDTRPLLRTPDPYRTLGDLFESRVPIYSEADLTVATEPGFSIDDTARAVLDALTTRPDVMGAK
ncbi:shikimate kinase [Roseivivax sp. GX 12232]|uniref:shikimate kinase n=1 Tax=Roseivivax sp. GX 12232 TaxID=2900547 RepID=UPI001E4051E7|nr:shikimate kinase [Roseivivax sp. GX 12232]MCE0504950.1 shikimate kinase [Roseivivax sp. GX 12232]